MVTAHILDIAEVAKLSRLPASTLRYYEVKGLIKSQGRHGLRRIFAPAVLEQLAFISLGRLAGFALDDLSGMLTANGNFTVDRKKVREQADDLDRRIKKLTALRDCLRHAADCPADDHFSCPTFQRLLRIAGRTRSRSKKKH